MKVKIFSRCGGYFKKSSRVAEELGQEVNAWLENNSGIEVNRITQSSCGGSLEPEKHLIAIWYDTGG